MILLADSFDSFTYNLYDQIASIESNIKVVKNNQIKLKHLKKLKPSKIILSPGAGNPKNAGNILELINACWQNTPILGVCLGHQCIGQYFGAKVIKSKTPMHGRQQKIEHKNSKLFSGLQSPFLAARYNSLTINSLPKDFTLTAWDNYGEIMAIEHETKPIFGVQFHPESFLSRNGSEIIKNFLKM